MDSATGDEEGGASTPEDDRGARAAPWVRFWRWFLGSHDPAFRDPRVRVALAEPGDDRIRYAEMIAKQIEVEQGLANTRMMWNLTFQGFTIAGYALIASSSGSDPARYTLETLIACTSIVIAYATMRGVVASQAQRQYLKDCWAANNLTDYFPEPFSVTRTSWWGRFPFYTICLALILMWTALIVAQSFWEGDGENAVKIKVEGRPEVQWSNPHPSAPPLPLDSKPKQ
jgi:hypothetical protein